MLSDRRTCQVGLGGQYRIMAQNGPAGGRRGEILENWGEIKIISEQNRLLFVKENE